jgi:hypothetical protein
LHALGLILGNCGGDLSCGGGGGGDGGDGSIHAAVDLIIVQLLVGTTAIHTCVPCIGAKPLVEVSDEFSHEGRDAPPLTALRRVATHPSLSCRINAIQRGVPRRACVRCPRSIDLLL